MLAAVPTAPTLRAARRDAYESERPEVLALVPRDARRILDLGCAAGALGAALKARQDVHVTGVELSPDYAADADAVLDRVVCADVVAALRDHDLGTFDCVVAADVLEHLVEPWEALALAAERLRPGGTAVVSLPNVRYLLTSWTLLRRGRWPRDPAGLFDATHLRWFTPADARDLLTGAGLRVEEVVPRFWFRGRALALVRAASRVRVIGELLSGQTVLRGVKPS